jgi:hypothetical protein
MGQIGVASLFTTTAKWSGGGATRPRLIMPTIVFKTSVAGTGFSYRQGERVHVPDDIAEDMVKGGHAEYAKPPAKPKRKRVLNRTVDG